MSFSTYNIFYLITASVTFAINFGVGIYCLVQINKYKHKPFFRKRRPLVVFTSTFSLLCVNCGTLILPALEIGLEPLLNKQWENVILIIGMCCLFFGFLMPTLFVVRVWLFYYDMQLSQLLKNQNWQMAINPNIESKSWFLNPTNQRKYGSNGKYLIIIASIIALFECVTWNICEHFINLYFVAVVLTFVLFIIKVILICIQYSI